MLVVVRLIAAIMVSFLSEAHLLSVLNLIFLNNITLSSLSINTSSRCKVWCADYLNALQQGRRWISTIGFLFRGVIMVICRHLSQLQ